MTIRMLTGDCREILKTLPDESVHCCVTSPPYFGLRDYGTAKWEWGNLYCDHLVAATGSTQNKANNGKNGQPFREICAKCGARRIDSQIGLEPTPDAYVAELVSVFREVRRVLRKDGTLWLNLGDSYAGGGGFSIDAPTSATSKTGKYGSIGALKSGGIKPQGEIKQKDLIGIPWLVAFALRADGWYLRQDIIWSKPNPMPESVTDRCTKAHEYLFLLSKSARYYWDAAAIAEDALRPEGPGNIAPAKGYGEPFMEIRGGLHKIGPRLTRNKRSVWEVATQAFSEAHFATFPPALIEPCIKAGCHANGTVIDPFAGAGTTGMVADRLGRNAVLIELNPTYGSMVENRMREDAGMFLDMKNL